MLIVWLGLGPETWAMWSELSERLEPNVGIRGSPIGIEFFLVNWKRVSTTI